MSFATDYAASAVPDLFAYHGQASSYTPLGGAAADITAIVGTVDESLIEDEEGQTLLRQRRVQVQTSQVAAPGRGDTITIASEAWKVLEVKSITGGVAVLLAVRPVAAEKTGEEYRGRR